MMLKAMANQCFTFNVSLSLRKVGVKINVPPDKHFEIFSNQEAPHLLTFPNFRDLPLVKTLCLSNVPSPSLTFHEILIVQKILLTIFVKSFIYRDIQLAPKTIFLLFPRTMKDDILLMMWLWFYILER